MKSETEELIERFRALPAAERSKVLERLLEDDADAPPDGEVIKAWVQLAERRLRDFDANPTRTFSWDEVRASAKRK